MTSLKCQTASFPLPSRLLFPAGVRGGAHRLGAWLRLLRPDWSANKAPKRYALSALSAVYVLVAIPAIPLGQTQVPWPTPPFAKQTAPKQPRTSPPQADLTAAVPASIKNAPSTPFGWIDFLMRTQQTHRAESELLRLMLQSPQHPQIPRAKIQRMLLYQAAQRHRLTQAMAYAFLDQYPNGPYQQHAWALLVNAHLSQGNLAQAQHSLKHWALAGNHPLPQLPKHLYATNQTHTLHKVAAWGSVFPGGGFFYQHDAQKGWWTLLLTLGLMGAGAAQFQQKHATTGAGLLVLLGVGVHIHAKYGALQQAHRAQTQALSQARKAWLTQWPGRLKLTFPF